MSQERRGNDASEVAGDRNFAIRSAGDQEESKPARVPERGQGASPPTHRASSSRDAKGWTRAHHAGYEGHLDVLKQLHENDASVFSDVTPIGQNPAHTAAKFCERNRELLRWIMTVEPSALHKQDRRGRTAISMIAEDVRVTSANVPTWLGSDSQIQQVG